MFNGHDKTQTLFLIHPGSLNSIYVDTTLHSIFKVFIYRIDDRMIMMKASTISIFVELQLLSYFPAHGTVKWRDTDFPKTLSLVLKTM